MTGVSPSLTSSSIASSFEDKPREAPPPATSLQLPQYPQSGSANHSLDVSQIYDILCKIPKAGPTKELVQAFNVQTTANVTLDQLIPDGYLPPTSWLADPATSGGSNVFPANLPPPTEKLRNGSKKPKHEEFYVRAKELAVDNEDAFRFLQGQKPLEGRPTVKIAHFRNVWSGISDMAGYWDTSLDNYVYPPAQPEAAAMEIDKIRAEAQVVGKGETTNPHSNDAKATYTGRRIGTGYSMPPLFREETVSKFVECIAWCFRCRVEKPMIQPKLRVHQMMITIVQSHIVYCTPGNQMQTRQGYREGPMMGISCRSSTQFRKPGEVPGEGKDELRDLLYEVSLGLMVAQKRDREGKEEDKFWVGKWWCENPRFGGAAVKPTEIDDDDDDEGERKAEGKGKGREAASEAESSTSSRKKQKMSVARANWSSLKPPSSQYEKNVIYQHVGKGKDADCDDIYLISALAHHLAIVHLRVPTAYSAYLLSNPSADFVPAGEPWYKIEVRRSRWFDLLKKEDRLEAMRGVWGVIGWLTRKEEGEVEN